MSVTVKDCLQLPSLSMGNVLAGELGLDNIVNTISVIEFDDNNDNFYVPNEMLITSLYCARDDVEEQCRIIQRSKETGAVALILFYSDIVLSGIDPRLTETANRINMPLISLKGDDMGLKYSDVIQEVMQAVIMDRKAGNVFVNNTISRISQLPESERNLNQVLSMASNWAKASFFLCDESGTFIADSYWPLCNEKDKSLLERYLSGEVPEIRVLRLSVNESVSGSLYLYGVTHNNTLDSSMMNQVAELVQLFSTIWNYPIDLSKKESLIPLLLTGEKEQIHSIAMKFRFPVEKIENMLIIGCPDEQWDINERLVLKNTIQELLCQEEILYIVNLFSDVVVVFYEPYRMSEWNEALLSRIFEAASNMSSGCYCTCFNGFTDYGDFRAMYACYCDNIFFAHKIYPRTKILSYEQILFASRCHEILLNPEQKERDRLASLLTPLHTEKKDELLETLTVYLLDTDSEVKQTSALFFVHRNTILYRLNKIRSLIGADINSMPIKYDLYLAVALERIK